MAKNLSAWDEKYVKYCWEINKQSINYENLSYFCANLNSENINDDLLNIYIESKMAILPDEYNNEKRRVELKIHIKELIKSSFEKIKKEKLEWETYQIEKNITQKITQIQDLFILYNLIQHLKGISLRVNKWGFKLSLFELVKLSKEYLQGIPFYDYEGFEKYLKDLGLHYCMSNKDLLKSTYLKENKAKIKLTNGYI